MPVINANRTTDEIYATAGPPGPEEHATRFVDVHIYDYEPELKEPSSVESEPAPGITDESSQENTEPAPPRRYRAFILVCVALLCVLGMGAFILVPMLPIFTPEATIVLVPNTQAIHTTQTITVTTGQVTGTQLQGRALAAITMTQIRTVPTTGKGHQDAKAAQGTITFYNAATYPQTVTAGTLLTGADGVQVITEQDATIPAASYPTFGETMVLAQSTITGPEGNIQAGDIYGPCCRLNVSAVSSAFTGGVSARDYQTVTSQDVSIVVSSLKTSLSQSVQAALQTQVHRDETLITPFPCQQNVKPDRQPGEEAAQVTIMVSETCIGITYRTQTYQDRITQIMNEQAAKQLGDGYTSIGQVQNNIIQTTTENGNRTTLRVMLAETYSYQVSQQQQQQIKTLIAGEKKIQATKTLLHIPDIQSVSVSSDIIPTDIQHIHVIVVYIVS